MYPRARRSDSIDSASAHFLSRQWILLIGTPNFRASAEQDILPPLNDSHRVDLRFSKFSTRLTNLQLSGEYPLELSTRSIVSFGAHRVIAQL